MSTVDLEQHSETAPQVRRGRPKGPSGKVCRDVKITFRCTQQEKLELEKIAQVSRLSMGDWLRSQLLG